MDSSKQWSKNNFPIKTFEAYSLKLQKSLSHKWNLILGLTKFRDRLTKMRIRMTETYGIGKAKLYFIKNNT